MRDDTCQADRDHRTTSPPHSTVFKSLTRYQSRFCLGCRS